MNIYNPTNEELQEAYIYLAEEIISHFESHPDCIIGLHRGGLIPAVHISHLLEVPLKIADYSHKDSVGDNKHSHDHIIPVIPDHIQKLVIVDDILDTGHTINGLFEALQLPTQCETIIISLYIKHGAIQTPNVYRYTWQYIPADAPFVNFPWEIKLK